MDIAKMGIKRGLFLQINSEEISLQILVTFKNRGLEYTDVIINQN